SILHLSNVSLTAHEEIRINEAASRIVNLLFQTDNDNPHSTLDVQITSIVHQAGVSWSSYLAQKILAGLEAALKAGREMMPAMKTAYEKSVGAAVKEFKAFAIEHPILTGVFLTVVAIGVLVLLVPWAVEALGFAELGPVEGTCYCTSF
ncbi:MAG: hypothetical protein Q9179_007988, partial [Wetmoreana sp. 5 TL-2023]